MPPWAQVLGDQAFLALLDRLARGLEIICDQPFGQDADPPGGSRDGTRAPSNAGLSGLLSELLAKCSSVWRAEPRVRDLASTCITALVSQAGIQDPGIIRDQIRDRAKAARIALWKLSARRYPKLAYRLPSRVRLASKDLTSENMAATYSDPTKRYALERQVEAACCLPLGTIHIHCPTPTAGMKIAQALVVGNDLAHPVHLRDIAKLNEELGPYQAEIQAVENMYRAIWRLHLFVDEAYAFKRKAVAYAMKEIIKIANDELVDQFPNDEMLEPINVYDLLVERSDQFGFKMLPKIVKRLDLELSRLRKPNREPDHSDLEEQVDRAIEGAYNSPMEPQPSLPL